MLEGILNDLQSGLMIIAGAMFAIGLIVAAILKMAPDVDPQWSQRGTKLIVGCVTGGLIVLAIPILQNFFFS